MQGASGGAESCSAGCPPPRDLGQERQGPRGTNSHVWQGKGEQSLGLLPGQQEMTRRVTQGESIADQECKLSPAWT